MSVGEGTATPTVADILDRLYLQWLTPPDGQDAQVPLAASIDDTETTVTFGEFTIPEDEALLRQGSLIELGQELVRVVSYNATAKSIVVSPHLVIRDSSGHAITESRSSR